jgi:hypothetical protein
MGGPTTPSCWPTPSPSTRQHAVRAEWLARGWVAVAGGDGDRARVAAVIDGLGQAAALDSWRLVHAIGQKLDVDEWSREAERRAATLVTMAGPLADDMRRTASEVFGSSG